MWISIPSLGGVTLPACPWPPATRWELSALQLIVQQAIHPEHSHQLVNHLVNCIFGAMQSLHWKDSSVTTQSECREERLDNVRVRKALERPCMYVSTGYPWFSSVADNDLLQPGDTKLKRILKDWIAEILGHQDIGPSKRRLYRSLMKMEPILQYVSVPG